MFKTTSEPLQLIQSCATSEVDCITMTNNCSGGRGECMINGLGCFTCDCFDSYYLVNGSLDMYGGVACERIDLVYDFHILVWLSIALIVAVTAIIGAMMRLGSMPFMPVQPGATARSSLKRD